MNPPRTTLGERIALAAVITALACSVAPLIFGDRLVMWTVHQLVQRVG